MKTEGCSELEHYSTLVKEKKWSTTYKTFIIFLDLDIFPSKNHVTDERNVSYPIFNHLLFSLNCSTGSQLLVKIFVLLFTYLNHIDLVFHVRPLDLSYN